MENKNLKSTYGFAGTTDEGFENKTLADGREIKIRQYKVIVDGSEKFGSKNSSSLSEVLYDNQVERSPSLEKNNQ